MQVNGQIGRVPQGKPLPDMDRAFDDTRPRPENLVGKVSTEESPLPAKRQPARKPPCFGAGF